MNEAQTGELLLLGGLLEKWRIPGILGALFLAAVTPCAPLRNKLTAP